MVKKSDYVFVTNLKENEILDFIAIFTVLSIPKKEFLISEPHEVIRSNSKLYGIYITKKYCEQNPKIIRDIFHAYNILYCKLLNIKEAKNIDIDDSEITVSEMIPYLGE